MLLPLTCNYCRACQMETFHRRGKEVSMQPGKKVIKRYNLCVECGSMRDIVTETKDIKKKEE